MDGGGRGGGGGGLWLKFVMMAMSLLMFNVTFLLLCYMYSCKLTARHDCVLDVRFSFRGYSAFSR